MATYLTKWKKVIKNDSSANAYGHYTHVEVDITGTITVATGHISVWGNPKKCDESVPLKTFKY